MSVESPGNKPDGTSDLLGAIRKLAGWDGGNGRVHRLEIHEHDWDGHGEDSAILNPPWSEIEAAIRNLDRRRFPFVTIHLNEKENGQEGVHCLCVMGGEGEYA
jgi:hypothetical protein